MIKAAGDKISQVFTELVNDIYTSFTAPFKDLSSLNELIYGGDSRSDLIWGTFQPNELTMAYLPVFNVMQKLAIIAFVAFIVFAGVRLASSQLLPARRNEALETCKDLLIVAILLMNLPTVYNLLFYINDALVSVFASAKSVGIGDWKLDADNPADDAFMGQIFISLIVLGLAVWANFYYIMRKITLIIFMAMGPIMVVCLMFPRWKSVFGTWFKELTGTIFIQSIHAGVFWTVAVLSGSTDDYITSIFIYVLFIPISESIRKLLGMGGDTAGTLNRIGGMAGLTALATVAGAIKGVSTSDSISGALSGAGKGAKGTKGGGPDGGGETTDTKSTIGAVPGGDTGTTKNAESMLKAGELFSKAGKATAASAGAIAGMGMGPVGVMVGSKVGETVGGAAGVVGRGAMAATIGGANLAGAAINRFKAGGEAYKDSLAKSTSDDLEGKIEDGLTEKGLNDWDENMSAGVRKDLQERFPDATPEEIDKKLGDVRETHKQGLQAASKKQLSMAKDISQGVAQASDMKNSTVESGTQQWVDNNKSNFNENYAKDNPQKPGESVEEFEDRRDKAFNSEVTKVRTELSSAADSVGTGSQIVSRKVMQKAMGDATSKLSGDVSGMSTVMETASNAVQSPSILNSSGIPNMSNLSQSLASAATTLQGEQYVANQVSNGVPEAVAKENWQANEGNVHASNVEKYSSPAFTNKMQAISNQVPLSASSAKNVLSATASAASATMMIPELKEFSNKTGAAMLTSLQAGQNATGVISSVGAAASTFASTMSAVPEGEATTAASNFANTFAIGAGVVLGAGGYAAAKKFATSHNPYANQAQNEISSASEVMQQAQTITDDFGNTQIAPGAIRQVITPNSSHVEVLTKGGEKKIVSRNGSGHSGLANGDKVYQDLQVQGDMLVPANKGATYRMDSGGARIPSSVVVNTDPNNLLGNPLSSSRHAYQPQSVPSAYNQKVDAGNFYTEDIASHGMEDLSVVVTQSGQYLQGIKEGITHRLSPMYAGDTRLDSTDSLNIPVNLVNNSIVANQLGATNSVKAFMNNAEIETDYFSSAGVKGISVPSKHTAHVEKMQEQKNQVEQYRRKQGIVG